MQSQKSVNPINTANELVTQEETYFVVTDMDSLENDQTDYLQSNKNSALSEDAVLWSDLCRTCAGISDHLIPIFEGEGLQNELCDKILKYLPIQVSENDTLPLQLCYECAATLVSWHELLQGCLTAEQKLQHMYQALQDKEQCTVNTTSDESKQFQDATSISNCAQPVAQHEAAVKNENEKDIPDSERWQAECNHIMHISTTENGKIITDEIQYIQCAECDIVFVDLDEFKEHLSVHKETCNSAADVAQVGQDLKCNGKKIAIRTEDIQIEDAECENTNPLSIKSEKMLLYTCSKCNKSFGNKADLKKHVSSHPDMKRVENPEEVELVNRARQMINERLSYKCDTCNKLMYTKRGFLRHIRVHFGKRPCKCEYCGKCYRIEQDLARHVRDVHDGLKNYACDICGRAFANKGAKDDHRRIHTGERPYACEHCPKTFRTLNAIYIHNRIHNNYKPHKCSHCGKLFGSKQRLNNHVTTHTGAKDFACEICGKLFSVKGEVMRHRAVHNEEKPFDCKRCGLKFGQKRYLKNHVKHHHKDELSLLLPSLTENHS